MGLVAVLTLMTLELIRSSGPLLDTAYRQGGVTGVAGTALITYLTPGLIAVGLQSAVGRGFSGSARVVLLIGAALLAGLRLVVQGLEGGARFVVGLATVGVGVAVLTLAVAILAGRPGGGRSAAGAVSAGAAAGVGLQLALGTWDAYWRHTLLGWSVTVAVVGSLLGLAILVRRDPATDPSGQGGRLWASGPLLGLGAMMLANPAFAASQSGLPLALAGPVNAAGLLLASWTVMPSSPSPITGGPGSDTPRSARLIVAGALVVLVAAALSFGGLVGFRSVLVLLALVGAQVAAIKMLSSALEPADRTPEDGTFRLVLGTVPVRVAGTAGLVGLGTIVPLLVYQIDYDLPLPFPNELVLVATAAALAFAGLRRTSANDAGGVRAVAPAGWTVLAASGALVLVGTSIAALAWGTNRQASGAAAAQRTGSGRVVSWNVHYGVSPAGSVDLEAVARTIEAQNPDAVLLQEVSRGWILGGGVDVATWLSNRLDQQFVFAPAADRRFGNVVMSPERPREVELHVLPYGDGPQNRSAISAQVRVGADLTRVTSVHLQNRRANTSTRIRQLESLLADLRFGDGQGLATIVGGDLNAEPGWPEIALMTNAGFISAIDAAGDPKALTNPNPDPTHRIDWVFGRGVTFDEAQVLVDAGSSDHLPLVVVTAR